MPVRVRTRPAPGRAGPGLDRSGPARRESGHRPALSVARRSRMCSASEGPSARASWIFGRTFPGAFSTASRHSDSSVRQVAVRTTLKETSVTSNAEMTAGRVRSSNSAAAVANPIMRQIHPPVGRQVRRRKNRRAGQQQQQRAEKPERGWPLYAIEAMPQPPAPPLPTRPARRAKAREHEYRGSTLNPQGSTNIRKYRRITVPWASA